VPTTNSQAQYAINMSLVVTHNSSAEARRSPQNPNIWAFFTCCMSLLGVRERTNRRKPCAQDVPSALGTPKPE
jgi:hypothetical protein